ncbi:MAG: hypothetical protein IKW08_03795 [Roseburia sp.]|nr:hypothetical protein [Roseburia sp.]
MKIVVAGIIIGMVVAVVILKKTGLIFTRKNDASKEERVSQLIENQWVCDELDTKKVIHWFRENAALANGEVVFFLAKPTPHTAKMFALQDEWKQLDPEHNLLQVIVDEKVKLPVAVRVISFNTMPQKLADEMKEREYMLFME